MSEPRKCNRCGVEMPADAPEGLCPECLLQQAMKNYSKSGQAQKTTTAPAFVAPALEEIAKHFPQLEILEVLGQGGMGVVYKARQCGLDRLVALKILPPNTDPAFAERFTREARALARLSHPGLVTVHDFGQSDGLYYFIMEYVDGVNLRQVLREGKLKPEEALKIIPQVCEALQYAHEEGIVHRDVKPENILMDKKGRVKIADFGLVKLLGKPLSDVSLTGSQQIMGTRHYMAPEQMERPQEVDHRADIFSLGVVLYEMLTGELPLGRFAPPSQKVQVDVRLDEVVLRSLEKEPERRYQRAGDVKTDMDIISRSSPPSRAATGKKNQPANTEAMTQLMATEMKSDPTVMKKWPIGTILASILVLVATLLPWGKLSESHQKRLYVIGGGYSTHPRDDPIHGGQFALSFLIPSEGTITVWNSSLFLGHLSIPNWTVAVVALAIVLLSILKATDLYPTAVYIPALSTWGIIHVGIFWFCLSTHGNVGIGVLLSLASFLAMLAGCLKVLDDKAGLAMFFCLIGAAGGYLPRLHESLSTHRMVSHWTDYLDGWVNLGTPFLILGMFLIAAYLSRRIAAWRPTAVLVIGYGTILKLSLKVYISQSLNQYDWAYEVETYVVLISALVLVILGHHDRQAEVKKFRGKP